MLSRQSWLKKLSVPEEILAGLSSATSFAMAMKLVFDLEDRYAPAQLQDMLPTLRRLSGFGLEACQRSYVLRELRRAPAQGYTREEVAPDVVIYRGDGEPAQKTLIVTLCGRSQRPNMPWSLFVQYLPAELFDVVILCDRRDDHYNSGVEGYAPDLMALRQRLEADLHMAAYRKVICYGTSSGGFPAIRLGLLGGAQSSIAIGGVFAWPIFRLQEGRSFQSFDPICPCFASGRGKVLILHASNDRDRVGAEQAARALDAKRIRITSTTDHNVNHQMFLAGRLWDFHQRLFEFGGKSF